MYGWFVSDQAGASRSATGLPALLPAARRLMRYICQMCKPEEATIREDKRIECCAESLEDILVVFCAETPECLTPLLPHESC